MYLGARSIHVPGKRNPGGLSVDLASLQIRPTAEIDIIPSHNKPANKSRHCVSAALAVRRVASEPGYAG